MDEVNGYYVIYNTQEEGPVFISNDIEYTKEIKEQYFRTNNYKIGKLVDMCQDYFEAGQVFQKSIDEIQGRLNSQ